jgi:hypothetical protein
MNRSKLRRLEEAFASSDADNPRLPASVEERRRLFVEGLPPLLRQVYREDDPRADPAHLATLTLPQLHGVYKEAVQADIAAYRATNPPQLEAFRRLPVSEKIRILRSDYRSWPAALRHP